MSLYAYETLSPQHGKTCQESSRKRKRCEESSSKHKHFDSLALAMPTKAKWPPAWFRRTRDEMNGWLSDGSRPLSKDDVLNHVASMIGFQRFLDFGDVDNTNVVTVALIYCKRYFRKAERVPPAFLPMTLALAMVVALKFWEEEEYRWGWMQAVGNLFNVSLARINLCLREFLSMMEYSCLLDEKNLREWEED
jgi:hypothetical protein